MYIHKYKEKELHKEQKLMILLVFPVVFFIAGILFSFFGDGTNFTLYTGFKNILLSPTILITDFLSVGGIGSTLINVSLISFFNLYLLRKYKLRINGLILAAFMTVMGFSFFGKNIFNIIPIYIGGYLYSYHKRIDFKDIIVSIMFATALAPVISEISFSSILPAKIGILIGISIGIFIGFIITPLASHMVKFYDGYNIYNLGFTAGILGTILTSALRSLHIEIESVNILYLENNIFLILTLIFIFVYLIVIGISINKNTLKEYKHIFKYSGKVVTDYTYLMGYGITFFNMGVMGLLSLSFVLLIGGVVNGPVIAGIFTVVGFSAFGKHLKNCIPVILGVITTALFLGNDISATGTIITILFSTTLAPIAGVYGSKIGFIAGILHFLLATNVGIIHGGVNLYNNGFAGGLVAGFLLPILDAFVKRR
ncbi:DUF1576 domain-containing protein [Romboutsia sp. 13368]|uniref:DUF1576 domain-containing protein n=1 Tax=Romboutsia sp. 13368 TaxID=2708053 RepID=UPI0025D3A71A|nr:DUF1576 domain-containing protein [Romboutsia sp. 13368]